MVFGLIISIILFLIDRSEKKRQEETLRRQDESLDIILEQVSKVNVFQTRTLSLAIESLGKDFENFKKDIDTIKASISNVENSSNTGSPAFSRNSQPEDSQVPSSNPLTTLSANFGNVLSKQINNFVDQIKDNLSELSKSETKDNKNMYKVKKGLEFDIKDLFNIQSMLDDLTNKQEDSEDIEENSIDTEDMEELGKPRQVNVVDISKDEHKSDIKDPKLKNKKHSQKLDFDNLNLQLDKLESIPDLVKFTESIINKFESDDFLNQVSKAESTTGTIDKKRVKPTKTITKEEFEDQNNSN